VPTSHLHNVKDALRPLADLYADHPVTEFGPLRLKAIRQHFIERGLSRGTVNKLVGTIRRVFKWGTENELVPATVYHALQAVAGLRRGRSTAWESEPVKPVAQAHVEALLPHVAPEVAAMIRLQEATGMRPGEVTIMRGCDIDRGGSGNSSGVWTYVPATHKTEHHGIERPIYLGPKAQEIVKPWLKADPRAHLFDPRDAIEAHRAARRAGRKTPMTPSQAARRRKRNPGRAPRDHYTAESYRRAIARGCVKADALAHQRGPTLKLDEVVVPSWHPNQLRHNAATRLRREFGIEAARIVLGHRSSAVTEIYAEIDHGRAAEVMARAG
jgi:integrase